MKIVILQETPIIHAGAELLDNGFAHILFSGVYDDTPVTLCKNGDRRNARKYTVVDGAIHPLLEVGKYTLTIGRETARFRVYNSEGELYAEAEKNPEKLVEDLLKIAAALETKLQTLEKRLDEAEGFDA